VNHIYNLNELYSISERLAFKNLLNQIFKSPTSDQYFWNKVEITIEKRDNLYFIKYPPLDILTYDGNLDLAFLNLIDQAISLYEEYQDHYDTDSDNLLKTFDSLFCEIYQKYQIRIYNTLPNTPYRYSGTGTNRCLPIYAGI